MKKSLLAFVGTLLGVALCGIASAAPTDIVPRGDIAYDLLAGMASQGRLPGYAVGDFSRSDRLYTRLEIARMLAGLTDVSGAAEPGSNFAAAERVLKSQFAPELKFLGVPALPNTMSPARDFFAAGTIKARLLTGPAAATATFRAAVTAPIGRDGYAAVSVSNYRNEWNTPAMPGASTAIRVRQRSGYPLVENAYLRVNGRALDVSVGLMPTRWGPGYLGAMLFSDEAANIPQVRIEKGFQFPGTLGRRIGPLHFTQFFGSFEEAEVPNAAPNATGRRRFLSGRRLETAGNSPLQLSFGEAFKSARLPDAFWSQTLPYYAYQNAWTTNNRRRFLDFLVQNPEPDSLWFNYVADANVNYRLSKKGTSVYFDLLLDDVKAPLETGQASSALRRKIGQQYGVYLPEFDSQGRFSARLEYVYVDELAYTHVSPPVAWTKEDFPLGFPGGPNGQIFFGRLDAIINEKFSAAIEGETRKRVHTRAESSEPNVDRVGLYGSWAFRRNIAFGARYEWRRYSFADTPSKTLSRWEANATLGF